MKLNREQIIKVLENWVKNYDGNVLEFTILCNALSLIKELTEENERLRGFNSAKCEDCAGCTQWKCDCSNIEAYTVRKMQERLKEAPIKVGLPLFGLQTKDEVEDYANGLILQMRDAIDQIAKEMLEDTDESKSKPGQKMPRRESIQCDV